MLNASRQTGGAVGVALVGGLLPEAAMGVVVAAYAGILVLTFALRRPQSS